LNGIQEVGGSIPPGSTNKVKQLAVPFSIPPTFIATKSLPLTATLGALKVTLVLLSQYAHSFRNRLMKPDTRRLENLQRSLTPENLGLLIARVMIAAIFVWSGFGKLSSLSQFTAGMVDRGLPFAHLLAPVGAVVEFAAAVALILGAGTRIAALALAFFTVVATMVAHRFWDLPVADQPMQSIQFMKNVAIIGGLAALIAVGGGRFSFDGMLGGPTFPAKPPNNG
jgi:putative oxidoreductase